MLGPIMAGRFALGGGSSGADAHFWRRRRPAGSRHARLAHHAGDLSLAVTPAVAATSRRRSSPGPDSASRGHGAALDRVLVALGVANRIWGWHCWARGRGYRAVGGAGAGVDGDRGEWEWERV